MGARRDNKFVGDIAKMVPVAMTMMVVLGLLFFTGLYLDVVKPVR